MSTSDRRLDFCAIAEPWAWDEVAAGYHSPALRVIHAALRAESGAAGDEPVAAPLSEPATFEAEMRAAGFSVVEVHGATHAWVVPSLDVLWRGLERAHVGLAIARGDAR